MISLVDISNACAEENNLLRNERDDLLKKYKPRKINDLSLVNASLRPSGASYRDRLINGEFNQIGRAHV